MQRWECKPLPPPRSPLTEAMWSGLAEGPHPSSVPGCQQDSEKSTGEQPPESWLPPMAGALGSVQGIGSPEQAQALQRRGDGMTVLTNRRPAITHVRAEGTCGQLGSLTSSSHTCHPCREIKGSTPSLWPSLTPLVALQGSRGELLLSLCYNPSANSIIVNIIKARNLKAMDIGGTSGAEAYHGRMGRPMGGSFP